MSRKCHESNRTAAPVEKMVAQFVYWSDEGFTLLILFIVVNQWDQNAVVPPVLSQELPGGAGSFWLCLTGVKLSSDQCPPLLH